MLNSLYDLAVPVVEPGNPPRLLGTAFPVKVGESSWFMTARHVAQAANSIAVLEFLGPPDRPIFEDIRLRAHDVGKIVEDVHFDIALLGIPSRWSDAPLPPFGLSGRFTARLANIEFSQSLPAMALREFRVEPSHHTGYAVRQTVVNDRSTGCAMHVIVCSWFALKGASGSPVLELEEGSDKVLSVAGMVIENQESELLPAHFEEIVSDTERSERHVYFAPNAIAIGFEHLFALLNKAESDGQLHF
jgi:hypothetical protein